MINSRSKGQRAERDLAAMIHEELGIRLIRNMHQYQQGGADLVIDPTDELMQRLSFDWSIEVKSAEKLEIDTWWRQALEQASLAGKKPCLAIRQRYQSWRFLFRLADIADNYSHQSSWIRCEVDFVGFVLVVRESLRQQKKLDSEVALEAPEMGLGGQEATGAEGW